MFNQFAQAQTTLSGTYGCVYNSNFSGFNVYQNGHSSHISSIVTFTFDASTRTGTFSGISTMVKNYDLPTVYNEIKTTTGAVTYEANNPSAGIYKATDFALGLQGIYYLIPVNSGNTLLIVRTPSAQPIENGVCQKI